MIERKKEVVALENTDMLKMLEKVSNIKKAFEMNESKAPESSEEGSDSAKLIKAMEIMQLLKSSQGVQKKDKEAEGENVKTQNAKNEQNCIELHKTLEKHEIPEKFFDDSIVTSELKSIKASIPYLDPKYQRSIGVFVKLVEIKKLIEMFSEKTIEIQDAQGKDGHFHGDYRLGMLKAIKPHMEGDKKDKVEVLIKFIEIKNLIDKLKESSDIYEFGGFEQAGF